MAAPAVELMVKKRNRDVKDKGDEYPKGKEL
jgi:hypothetical protein